MAKATQDLYIGFTKVYNKGAEVSDKEVKEYNWEDQVETTEPPAPEPEDADSL
jgi:hypothetical protein